MNELTIISPKGMEEAKTDLLLLSAGEGVVVEEGITPKQLSEEFAAKYKSIPVPTDIDDLEGFKKANEARLELYRKRREVSNKGKEYAEQIKSELGKLNSFVGELVAPLQIEEKRLKDGLDKIKQARKDREEKERREAAQRYNNRTLQLGKMGGRLMGDFFEVEKARVSTQRINTATEEEWKVITEKIEALKAERLQREADAEAERQKAAAEKKRVEDENAALKAELEALRAKLNPAPEPEPEPEPKPAPKEAPKAVKEEKQVPLTVEQKPEPKAVQEQPKPKELTQLPPKPNPVEQKPKPSKEPTSPFTELLEVNYGKYRGNSNFAHFENGWKKGGNAMKDFAIELIKAKEYSSMEELIAKIKAL